MARILVVEDEPSIQKMVAYDIKELGHEVDVTSNGSEGLQKAMNTSYDIILLDLMLPGMSGLEIAQILRKNNHSAHIIMLTAMDEEYQKIEGFEQGADDYITKPFSPRELTARIKAVLRRRNNENNEEILIHQNITLNTLSYEAFIEDHPLNLTLKEFELLQYLIRNKGVVVSRDQLLRKLWGYSYDGDTRVVDVHIFKLREKMDPHAETIKTVRGIGYKLV